MFGIVMNKSKRIKLLLYLVLGYFSYLMLLITLQYIPINFNAAFLGVKQVEIEHPYYQISFFTHVYTSIFTVFIGFVQFSKTLRNKFPLVHRNIGKCYIGIILIFSGPTGLVMGVHANGGFYSKLSFCILSVLWIFFTLLAYVHARKKNWVLHKNYMYRSYALTLSAVSLRLFKWMIVGAFSLPPMDTYQIVAWLGWVINLLIAEYIIRFNSKKKAERV
jgi:hypothetical protein